MNADERVPSSRRVFLQQAAGIAAGMTALTPGLSGAETPAAQLLPTIQLGPHSVTRLIIGGNPVYGYSHFNKLLSQHMTDWHTPERVLALLKRCEQAGINTWQNSYAPRTLDDVDRVRSAGVQFHWLCLGKSDWDRKPELIADAANTRNYPVVMGTVLIMTAFYVTITIAADLLIARLDPRVRDVFRG